MPVGCFPATGMCAREVARLFLHVLSLRHRSVVTQMTTETPATCPPHTTDSSSSFYYSFLFLSRPQREAISAVYALCHQVDTTIDHPSDDLDPHDQLAQWRQEIEAMYRGMPRHPLTIRLREHVNRLAIPQAYFQELLNGMAMDLTIRRYATFDELSLYCYRVASVVGLICLHIFGTTDPRAHDYAIHLGTAFQLTNIMRDLGADAKRNRIYVPQEDLVRFHYSERQLLTGTYSAQFIRLMAFQAARTREYYRKAQAAYDALSSTNRQALRSAEIMRAIYFALFTRIEKAHFAVFASRIRVPPPIRLVIALMAWVRVSVTNSFSQPT